MRKADVDVGADYAARHPAWLSPRRVRVEGFDDAGRAEVTVLVDDAHTAPSWVPGEQVTISTQNLLSPWVDWEIAAADRTAAHRARGGAAAEGAAAAEVADPARPLPASYDDIPLHVPDSHYAAELVSAAPNPATVVVGALDLLPDAAARDVVAAAIELRRLGGRTGRRRVDVLRAGTVFAGAAQLAINGAGTLSPREVLADHDQAFVDACQATVAEDGEALETPFVPRLRSLDSRFDDELKIERPALGWVRLADGRTSGRKLHAPRCPNIRPDIDLPLPRPTMPLWETTIGQLCGRCGGPGVVVSPAWVAFRAASDTWAACDQARPEGWQVRALQHLIADASRARALAGEADRTLIGVVLDALAEDMPRYEGWDAHRLVQGETRPATKIADATRDVAARLVYRRLRVLHDALPPGMRPEIPEALRAADVDGQVSGPTATVDDALCRWNEELTAAVDVDDLYLSLFGLPGAFPLR